MNPLVGLGHAWRWSVRKILGLWVRVTIKPEDAVAAIAARPRPVCYVLERESHSDFAVLNNVCAQHNLPRPTRRLMIGGRRADRAYFELTRPSLFGRRNAARAPRYLVQLIDAAAAHPQFDLDLVPVAIFWGRAPHKEISWWRLPFTEDWILVGRFRKFLSVVFNGRNTLVYFGEPIRLRDALDEGLSEPRSVRRVLRTLRTILRAQRASSIGPDLSHRRTMVLQVLKTQAVRQAVRNEMQVRQMQRRPALLLARKYALEIAANYSQAFITFMAMALGRLWNSLYDGVELEHIENLSAVGDERRNHLRAVPPQPHGLSAAVVRHLSQRFCRSARRRGRESQHAADRPLSAQGRRLLPAPQLQGRRAVPGRVRQVPRLHDGARPSARVLHRGRPQPHRAAALAAHRHAVDDGAQLSARPETAGEVHAGVLRLRAHRRGQDLYRRALGAAEAKGKRIRFGQIDRLGHAQQIRQSSREPGRAHRPRCAAAKIQPELAFATLRER